MRYHSLVVEGLAGTPLMKIAETGDGTVMALAHERLPLLGVQFHPESILTEYGHQLLENWVYLVREYRVKRRENGLFAAGATPLF